eukprot:8719324-Pyramimonas_sp.AAC.1
MNVRGLNLQKVNHKTDWKSRRKSPNGFHPELSTLRKSSENPSGVSTIGDAARQYWLARLRWAPAGGPEAAHH